MTSRTVIRDGIGTYFVSADGGSSHFHGLRHDWMKDNLGSHASHWLISVLYVNSKGCRRGSRTRSVLRSEERRPPRVLYKTEREMESSEPGYITCKYTLTPPVWCHPLRSEKWGMLNRGSTLVQNEGRGYYTNTRPLRCQPAFVCDEL